MNDLNKTIGKELREIRFLLRKSFGYAFRHRLISVNPMPDVEIYILDSEGKKYNFGINMSFLLEL